MSRDPDVAGERQVQDDLRRDQEGRIRVERAGVAVVDILADVQQQVPRKMDDEEEAEEESRPPMMNFLPRRISRALSNQLKVGSLNQSAVRRWEKDLAGDARLSAAGTANRGNTHSGSPANRDRQPTSSRRSGVGKKSARYRRPPRCCNAVPKIAFASGNRFPRERIPRHVAYWATEPRPCPHGSRCSNPTCHGSLGIKGARKQHAPLPPEALL